MYERKADMGTKSKAQSRIHKVPWKGPPRIRVIENKHCKVYEVDLGKLHQGLGTAGRRKTYPALVEAMQACHEIRRELEEQGTEAFRLTGGQKADAVSALKECGELGIASLSEAIERLKPFIKPRAGNITIKDLRAEWLKFFQKKVAEGKRKPRALQDLQKRTDGLVGKFGDRFAKEMAPLALWRWLTDVAEERKWATITLRHEHQAVSQLFTYARKKGYVGMNPLDAPEIEFEKEERLELPPQAPPRVFTLDETRRLLEVAHDQNGQRELLGFVSLLLFTGLRPIAEGSQIDWEDVDLEGRKLYVRPDKSKNRTSDRVIPICNAAVEWLMLHKGKDLVPHPLRTLESRWQQTRIDAGIENRSGTSLSRHSYASYRYAIHQSQNRLKDELGHSDKAMLAHYRSLRPEITKAAPLYFGMNPAEVLGDDSNKTVSFQAAG
jgi:integrase